uniref:HIT domain-containing protein n=1 Tax=Takifugu rubripes TaxID=31033 RepID=A0A674P7D4_TAKRU
MLPEQILPVNQTLLWSVITKGSIYCLVVFKDIYPAAPHHYLVVPIQHLTSFHSLQRRHVDLVERMAEMGKAVLHDQGITDMSDIRLGFHQPPYTSVDHLHLHVLAPARQISQYSAFKFIPESYRFVTVSAEYHLVIHSILYPC